MKISDEPNPLIHALSVGQFAHDYLTRSVEASVFGVTSRGIFLKIPPGHILFLSFEHFRGPLTLNLFEIPNKFHEIYVGEPVKISGGLIDFYHKNLVIDFNRAEVWHAPLRTGNIRPRAERVNLLRSLTNSMLSSGNEEWGAQLLRFVLDTPRHLPNDQVTESQFLEIMKAHETFRTNPRSAVATLASVLGRGHGLTPSGDDFLVGMFLALARFGTLSINEIDFKEIGREIIGLAYQRTTNLSANMIEAATAGLADERLVRMVDSLFMDMNHVTQSYTDLLNWGASSGVDALAGMAFAAI